MLGKHDAQVGVEAISRMACLGGEPLAPVACLEAEVEDGILAGIGVATHEIAVVFAFAPRETEDGRERLIGIPFLPAGADICVRLEVLGPVRKPVELQLALADGCTDAK